MVQVPQHLFMLLHSSLHSLGSEPLVVQLTEQEPPCTIHGSYQGHGVSCLTDRCGMKENFRYTAGQGKGESVQGPALRRQDPIFDRPQVVPNPVMSRVLFDFIFTTF